MIEAALRDLEARFGVGLEAGLQLVHVGGLMARPFDPGWGLVIVPDRGTGTEIGRADAFAPPVLPGRHARPAQAQAVLAALYPADHPALELLDGQTTTVGALDAEALAARGPVNVISPELTPLRLYTGTTPPMMAGNCIRPFLSRSSGFIGMSDAPKSTVLDVICLMPPPEPIDW